MQKYQFIYAMINEQGRMDGVLTKQSEGKKCKYYREGGLAWVTHAVIQAILRTELEDGTRTGVRLKRLHAHSGVCTSPTVMLNPLLGMTWLWGWGRGHNSHAKT